MWKETDNEQWGDFVIRPDPESGCAVAKEAAEFYCCGRDEISPTAYTQPDLYTLGCPATRTISMVSAHSRKLPRKISARTSCWDSVLRIPHSKVGSWGPSSSGEEFPVAPPSGRDK